MQTGKGNGPSVMEIRNELGHDVVEDLEIARHNIEVAIEEIEQRERPGCVPGVAMDAIAMARMSLERVQNYLIVSTLNRLVEQK